MSTGHHINPIPNILTGIRLFAGVVMFAMLAGAAPGALDAWLKKNTGDRRDTPIVFMGAGMNDRSSYNAALRAGTLGWRAYWYRGGMEAWTANGLPTAPVKPAAGK